jgi:hypothetical protein
MLMIGDRRPRGTAQHPARIIPQEFAFDAWQKIMPVSIAKYFDPATGIFAMFMVKRGFDPAPQPFRSGRRRASQRQGGKPVFGIFDGAIEGGIMPPGFVHFGTLLWRYVAQDIIINTLFHLLYP